MSFFKKIKKGVLVMGEKKRSTWATRGTFILAAIGSAVGLGNAWRFPGLAAKHGGGTFLLVYLVAMFVMGLPLLVSVCVASARRWSLSAGLRLQTHLSSLPIIQLYLHGC